MAGSRWVKIDLQYLRNPKMLGLPLESVALHLASILWTAEHLTDGQIPDRALTELAQTAHIKPAWKTRRARQLVDRGLWVRNGAGWVIHDFEAMNPQAMRKIVEGQRERWADQKRRQRQ